MGSRAATLFKTSTRFAGARKPRGAFGRTNTTSASPRPTPWSPFQLGSLALAIAGTGFAAGIAYHKSKAYDINYSRVSKFAVPKYGSVKDMQEVRIMEATRRTVY